MQSEQPASKQYVNTSRSALAVPAALARQARKHPAIFQPIALFLLLRVLLLLWAWGVRQVFPGPFEPHPVLRPYLGVRVEENAWLEPWQRWDTLHYQAIAEGGYGAFEGATFVPPFYPLLMRALGGLMGGNTLLAGILIGNVACLGCLLVFYRIALEESGSQGDSSRALLYLAVFPSAFFLFAAYTESLFLLAAMLCLKYAKEEKYWQAGIWGALAALARLPGALLVLPLAYHAGAALLRKREWKAWSAALLTLLGAAAFPLYLWLALRLPPWTPWTIQAARFQGGLAMPGANLVKAVQAILTGAASAVDILDLLFLIFFAACAVPVWRCLPRIYAVYYLAFLTIYLVRTSAIAPLLSVSRYVLVFFPAFIVMGKWGRSGAIHRAILYGSWIGLLYLAGQFALWGWVG